MFQNLFNVEVIFMMEDWEWNDSSEILTMAEYLQLVCDLDNGVYPSDAWIKTVQFIYAPK